MEANLTRAVNRNAAVFFAFFIVAAIIAFWPGYLAQISDSDLHQHIHGLLMMLWLLMLISQAYLIRSNNRQLHRRIGKLAYALGPTVFLSIVFIAHKTLAAAPDINERVLAQLADRMSFAVLFALAFGLAMFHRDQSSTHARFMLCTPLPMSGPIFDRILLIYVAPRFDFIPRFVDGGPFPHYLVLPAVDLFLVSLAVWDWKAHRRLYVFPTMLAASVILQAAAFTLYDSDPWRRFTEWFLEALPF